MCVACIRRLHHDFFDVGSTALSMILGFIFEGQVSKFRTFNQNMLLNLCDCCIDQLPILCRVIYIVGLFSVRPSFKFELLFLIISDNENPLFPLGWSVVLL